MSAKSDKNRKDFIWYNPRITYPPSGVDVQIKCKTGNRRGRTGFFPWAWLLVDCKNEMQNCFMSFDDGWAWKHIN